LRTSATIRDAAWDEQNEQRGRAEFEEALGYDQALHDSHRVALDHDNLGYFEAMAGNLDEARSHHVAAAAYWEAAEGRPGSVDYASSVNQSLVMVALLQQDLPGAIGFLHRSVATGSNENTVAYQVLAGALCASAGADPERAAVLHGAADALVAGVDEVWPTLEADMRERDHRRLRELLGDAAFEVAYSEGNGIGKTDALALALHSPSDPETRP
jgi:hypothetical protein